MTELPCVQRMRALGSVTATTRPPSSAAARSAASIVRTATESGLDSHAVETSSGAVSGASATWGEMCQAERSQLDAISGRTLSLDVPAAGAVAASPTWRSHARVRDERRLRNSEVHIFEHPSPRMPRPVSAETSTQRVSAFRYARGKGLRSGLG
jgi:hypothetical protein